MNIYKLTDPRVKAGYMWGYYLSCVVVAESEKQARLMHPASAVIMLSTNGKILVGNI